MTTPLVCTDCGKNLATCACPDADARLKAVAFDPDAPFVMFKWCRICDRHYARCTCESPSFYIVSAGKEIHQTRFRTAAGEWVDIDLTRR